MVQELTRKGLPIRRLRPDRDKVERALVAVARYEEHWVFHPRAAAWLEEWEEELLAFPNAAHDDQVIHRGLRGAGATEHLGRTRATARADADGDGGGA